jgi:hypothetical protein
MILDKKTTNLTMTCLSFLLCAAIIKIASSQVS